MSIQDTKHRKHTALARPAYGAFHTHEWAVLGAPCDLIQALTARWVAALQADYPLAYVDADHPGAGDAAAGYAPAGAAAVYTDRIHFHEYREPRALDAFRQRTRFAAAAGVLVNGNHFLGKRQIVLLDPRKRESLARKLDRLTDVRLLLTVGEEAAVWDYLKTRLPHWQDLPRWSVDEHDRTVAFLRGALHRSRPPVKALVLAGGHSRRMGTDKGLLDYHGSPQRTHLHRQLRALGLDTYLSCRADQVDALSTEFAQLIPDTFTGLGPFGAILSAFRQDPTAAWLVVACDLPLLDTATLRRLLADRDATAYATAFHNPATAFPEPLVALWEPRGYGLLLQYLAQGYSCPRKVLINSPVRELHLTDASVLLNANRPADAERVRAQLAAKG